MSGAPIISDGERMPSILKLVLHRSLDRSLDRLRLGRA
jgi:hypothetical protein